MKKSISPQCPTWSTLLITLMISAIGTDVFGQQHVLSYKLIKDDKVVGNLDVSDSRSRNDRVIITTLNANVPALLLDVNLNDYKEIVYHDNILHHAKVSRKLMNGDMKIKITSLTGNRYSDGKSHIPGLAPGTPIQFSTTMLYTTEPSGIKSIYSEFHQKLLPIQKLAGNHYRIKMPGGETGNYFYENGLCVKIETTTPWAVIITILVNNKLAIK